MSGSAMHIAVRILVAITPLLATFVFVWLVSGPLNMGSGEKDIFLAIPLLLWSLLFSGCYLVLWWRGFTLGRSSGVSAGFATALVVIAWVVLLVVLLAGGG